MQDVLLVIHLLVAVALILVVLTQRTAQDGGGLMGGSSTMGGLFTARGSANLLTRTTAILATIFICSSLILGIMASATHAPRSLTETIAPQTPAASGETKTAPTAEKSAETPAKPSEPQVPVSK